MEFSRKKEVLTIIVSGLVPFVLISIGIGFYFLSQAACLPIGFFSLYTGKWLEAFITALIIGGYGAFVGWVGFKDFTSTKKLSARAVILTVVGLSGIFAFMLPICD